MRFDLAVPRRVLFGPGRSDELAGLLPTLGQKVLLCTGKDPSRHGHLLRGVDPVAVVTVRSEPTVDDVRAATSVAGTAGADLVVAAGGGSVLDLGKAVAVLLGNGTDPLDHLEVVGRGVPVKRPAVPYVAVPTTAGTGAEQPRMPCSARPSTASRRASVARTCWRRSPWWTRCSH